MTAQRKRKKNTRPPVPALIALCVILAAAIGLAIWFGVKSGGEPRQTEPSNTGSETLPGTVKEETGAPSEASDTAPSGTEEPETKAPETAAPETKAPETEAPETLPAQPAGEAASYDELGFKADIREYEKYMNPTGEQRDAYLLLVNTTHKLASDYEPEGLTGLSSTRKDGRGTQKMVLYAAKALEALYLDAEANGMVNDSTGYRLSVMSAYRPYYDQKYIYNDYVQQTLDKNPGMSREEAEAKVSTYSAPPGTSEHQSGLCCDMHNQKSASSSHPERYTGSPEMVWCMENCWKYGFVLRFPADKQEITGIRFEPWHYRYVGRYHAERMVKLGMCLEEYVEYLENEKK